MKILKLEISNIRGITDLAIEPNGKSFVIYGPNGSGKSAVIDALDFLLTGRIARLSGEGTEGVTLKQHGPHIDKVSDLSNVGVTAEIKIPGISESVKISRQMRNPNELNFDSKYEPPLAPILELLDRGQYVFTRREVLKLITAKSSTRAQEIQKVLKLTELEDIRRNLIGIYHEVSRDFENANISVRSEKQNVLAITGERDYDEAEVLDFVNEQRIKLGGDKLEMLEAQKIKEGLTGVQVNPQSINHKTLSNQINNLKAEEIDKLCIDLPSYNSSLTAIIKKIKDDDLARWNAKRYDFTKDGIELIRDSGECPLCDIEWPNGELHKYLQKRLDAESKQQTELKENSQKIGEQANAAILRIQQLMETIEPLFDSDKAKESELFSKGIEHLEYWKSLLTNLNEMLSDPLEKYSIEESEEEDINKLHISENNDEILDTFYGELTKLFPEVTSEQTAWDNLTKLDERVDGLEKARATLKNSHEILERATELGKAYVSARDQELENLYNNVKERFVGLYKEMHGQDEIMFDAEFEPQDAGIKLKVDFYNRGFHPPHAMHSEGHQDSMGVCLFLALTEHLNTGLIDLIILDDVVMSIDTGHRRAFCNVLADNFPNLQFIITTHDTTWANQLRGEGIVGRKQMLKFFDWDVDSGPKVHYEADMWSRIEEDLNKDDISAASAKLRNGLEEFTRYVCHNLRAKVSYTLDDGGSLGDFLPAALRTYNELLSKAKDAANSWNRMDEVESLNKCSEKAKEIIKRSAVEQWAINKTVHYNSWAKMSKEDFTPVVTAFRELCEKVFACDNEGCDSVLKVTFDGANKTGVRCKCGATNWNLIRK